MNLSFLPLELLPHLLESLSDRRQDLYQLCLVSKEFNTISTPMLYAWIRMFGRDLLHVPNLLRELSLSPRLCSYIRKLEIRVFPMPYEVSQRLELQQMSVKVLNQCVNLRELIWTRKGALTDSVLESIIRLPRLRRLEFNAHTNLSPGSWSPELLLELPAQLTSLSIILPDRKFASVLPAFLSNQAQHLEKLSILCRESSAINDKVLYHIIPIFSDSTNSCLTSLALAGCAKLTHAPLIQLFKYLPRLNHLALESNSIAPDSYSSFGPYLRNLVSLKLTHPGPRHSLLPQFYPALIEMINYTTSLESFTVYHSGTTGVEEDWPIVEEKFVRALVEITGDRLRKFEASGVLMSIESLEVLARGAFGVRELVVHLGYKKEIERLKNAIASLPFLRTLHILYQLADIDVKTVEMIADSASSSLHQIGLRNRVWTIKRTLLHDDPVNSKENYILDDEILTKGGLILVETADAFGAFRRAAYGAEPSDQLSV